jgi:hypothetical protein
MKDIIKQVLVEKEFVIDEDCFTDQLSFQADRINHGKFDFITVSFMDGMHVTGDDIDEKIAYYSALILDKKQKFMGIDKNLSLVLFLRVDSLDISPELNSLIFDIEENPYNFKKYILTYTYEQEELLKSLRGKHQATNIIDFLSGILMDSSKFSNFKKPENPNDFLIYDLVSKLFVKIPFLNIKNQNQILSNLADQISNSIEERDLDVWKSTLQLGVEKGMDPSIEDILKSLGVDVVE